MLTMATLRAALACALTHPPILGKRGEAAPDEARDTDATPLLESLARHLATRSASHSVDAALNAFEQTHQRRPACYWTVAWFFEWKHPERVSLRFLLHDPDDTPWDPLRSVWVELVLSPAPAVAA